MRYNMDFLVAALIFLIVLWHHFMKQRQYAGNKTEKTFQIFMMLGIGDILLDMVSTVVIDNSCPEFARMLYVILLLFYLCQLLIPPVLYLYTLALAGGAVEEKLSGIRCLWLLQPWCLRCWSWVIFRQVFYFLSQRTEHISGGRCIL